MLNFCSHAQHTVDEFIFHMTHDRVIDFFLPGVPATGKKLSIPMIAVVSVRGDRLYNGEYPTTSFSFFFFFLLMHSILKLTFGILYRTYLVGSSHRFTTDWDLAVISSFPRLKRGRGRGLWTPALASCGHRVSSYAASS